MKNKLIKITSKLVSFPTTTDNLAAIGDCYGYLKSLLSPLNLMVKEYSHNGVKSVVWLNQDTLTPDIMFNGHIDVVPSPGYRLTKDTTKLYGRGVADMKGPIASLLVALEIICQNKTNKLSIGLMLTSDEEQGGMDGVNYLVNTIGYHPKIVIIPDGGENDHITVNAKGVLHLEISAVGKSAHASDPWEGDNAIEKIVLAIQSIRQLYPQPNPSDWVTTINIGQISGGTQTNQVPDSAKVIIDIRYIPTDNPDLIKQNIQNVCPNCQVKKLICASPFHVDNNNQSILMWANLINPLMPISKILINENGASDARYFHKDKTTVILSSPILGNIHSDQEWVDIDSLISYTKCIIKFTSLL